MSDNGDEGRVYYHELYREFMHLTRDAAKAARNAVEEGNADHAKDFAAAASWAANGIRNLHNAGQTKIARERVEAKS